MKTLPESPVKEKIIRLALAGQPNVGKSTIFNLLTGLSQKVGNWPGKTVEKKEGIYRHNGLILEITDLPGTYSLTAGSLEERIARDYLIKEKPDVVILVVNAANLETNLYLLAEILSLSVPIVLALNMMDIAQREGIEISAEALGKCLGLPVVPVVATRNQGLKELVNKAILLVTSQETFKPWMPEIREDHRHVLEELENLIREKIPPPYRSDWVALKILEGDEEITSLLKENMSKEEWAKVEEILRKHEDASLAIVSGRYLWIQKVCQEAMKQPKRGPISTTDRLDKIATHPVWGVLFLLAVLALLFLITYSVGIPLQNLLDIYFVQKGAAFIRLSLSNTPGWLVGLLADGVIGGVGMVLTLLPILLIFFAALAFLEDVGYMARAAYVMDSFMHLMGLHGKSFLPIFLGFGCNVPAVMGSRIIESPRARLLTIMLIPLVPCTARMAVLAILAPIFFKAQAFWVSLGLIGLNLVFLALLGVILNKFILKGEKIPFIMELPLYHLPNLRTISLTVFQRTIAFLKKAGSIILFIALIVWALSYFPQGEIETSYLSYFGRWLAPLGSMIGLGWQMMVALLTSFVAKENVVSTLGVLFGAGLNGMGLADALAGVLTPLSAFAFLALELLFIPCVATLATIRQETGSWKWTLLNLAILFVLSFTVAIIIYQGGRLIGLA